jgi:NAD(P)-dependent dehydrogenase (short-subunit alcohol dehydrogenase family)
MNHRSPVVLVTGASSGIGRAIAKAFAAKGFEVFGTSRNPSTTEPIPGVEFVRLDVTDAASATAAVSTVVERAGRIDILVNNAGFGVIGAAEESSAAQAQQLFETNFFGLVRLTQLVLPGMRKQRGGRILNVSSMGGRATLPGGAFYHASKYAVEAFSDALRMEVAQFGIEVVLIEPGPVKTPWNDTAAGSLGEAASGSGTDPYAAYKAAVGVSFSRTVSGPLARLGSDAQDIAKVITRAVTAQRPRTRYLINPVAKSVVTLNRLLPGRAYDAVIRRQYGLPG